MSDSKSKLLSLIAGKSRFDPTTHKAQIQIRLPTALPKDAPQIPTVLPNVISIPKEKPKDIPTPVPVTPIIPTPMEITPMEITPMEITVPDAVPNTPNNPPNNTLSVIPLKPKRRRRTLPKKQDSDITAFIQKDIDPFNDPTVFISAKPVMRKRTRAIRGQKNQKATPQEQVSDDDDYMSDGTLFMLEGPPPDQDATVFGISYSIFETYRCTESYILSMSPVTWDTGIISLGHIPERGLREWRHPVYAHLQPYGFVYCIATEVGHVIIMITSNARTHANFHKSCPLYTVYHIIKKKELDREYSFMSRDQHLARLRSRGMDFEIRTRLADPHSNIIYLHLIGKYESVRNDPDARAKMDADISSYAIPIDIESFWTETNVVSRDYVRRSLQERHSISPGVIKYYKLESEVLK